MQLQGRERRDSRPEDRIRAFQDPIARVLCSRHLPLVLAVAIATGYVVSRTAGLAVSLWEDEMFTANRYVAGGIAAVFDPDLFRPNNHPLYSLLGVGIAGLFGNSEVPLRLGSVIPATIGTGLVTWWIWTRFNRSIAVIFVFLATVSPLHFEEFTQARGWGLAALAAGIVLVVSLEIQRGGRLSWQHLVWFCVGSLIGIWTIAPVIVAFAIHGAILLATRPQRIAFSGAALLIALASALFYWPLRDGLDLPPTEAERDGLVTLGNFIIEPVNRLVAPLLDLAVPAQIALLLGVMIVLAGVGALARRRDWLVLAHLTLPVLAVFFSLTFREGGVWDRYVSFLLFHILVLGALGLAELWSLARRWSLRPIAAVFGVILAPALALGFVDYAAPIISTPWENFKGAAILIDGTAPLEGAFTYAVVSEFNYNLNDVEVQYLSREEFVEQSCRQKGPAIFVDYHRRSAAVDTSCLERRATRTTLPQRRDPPISIWMIP